MRKNGVARRKARQRDGVGKREIRGVGQRKAKRRPGTDMVRVNLDPRHGKSFAWGRVCGKMIDCLSCVKAGRVPAFFDVGHDFPRRRG